jgi:hypothetical protein
LRRFSPCWSGTTPRRRSTCRPRSPPTNEVGGEDTVSADQLATLAEHDLVTIGNHTKSHPRLPRIEDEATLREEIVGAREALEAMIDAPVREFCYPYYRYDERSLAVVRESHDYAVAGPPGHPVVGPEGGIDADTDPCLVPRIDGITYSEFSFGRGIERLGLPTLRGA